MKMFQPRYVWILIGDYVERWWEAANDTSCTRHELAEAAQGYFTIDSLNSLSDDEISSANIVRSMKNLNRFALYANVFFYEYIFN